MSSKAYHAEWYKQNRDNIVEQRKKYYQDNREEVIARNKAWRKNNPDKLAASKRRYHLKSNFGISVAAYNALLEKQYGLCAICGCPPIKAQSLAVDHRHEDGKIRGLLCVKCNRGIGTFADSAELLNKAAIYIKESYE